MAYTQKEMKLSTVDCMPRPDNVIRCGRYRNHFV